jgi:sodium/proline symporter
MNSTIIAILVLYMAVCIAIGVWATKQTKTSSDFFIAGRNLGMFVMAIAGFSSVQSGFGLVGGVGLTFSNGLGFVTGALIAAPIGFVLTWFLIGKRMWDLGDKAEIYTLGDVAEYRYKSRGARAWVSFAVILGVIGYLGTQVQAMGIVMNTILGVSPKVGAIIGLVILAAYAVGGGMIAGVYTDLVQGIIMIIVALFVFVYAIQAGGGMLEITKTLQQAEPLMASPTGMFPIITVACWFFLMSFGMAGQPQLITKFLMVKNVKELKWGAFTAGLAYLITILLVIGIGLSAAALTIKGEFPPISSADETLTTFLLEYTPPVIAGLVLSGLLAAIMSTGDSFVNLGAACIVRDFPKAFKVKVKNELLWSRLAVVGLLVASALFAFYMNTLVGLLGVFGFGTFASALFPVIVLGLLWEKATTKGAIASIVVALASNFILEIGAKYGFKLLPPGVINGAFAFVLSIIVFITVSLFTYSEKEKVSGEMKEIIQG